MTQQVGLATYLRKKAKALFKRKPSPSFQSDGAEWTRKTSKPKNSDRPRPAPFSERFRVNNTTNVIQTNGKTYKEVNGRLFINGKEYPHDSPEYAKFKKEMDEQTEYWNKFAQDMGKMASDMGTSAAEAAKNIGDIFK